MCGFKNDRQQILTHLYLLSQSYLCFSLLLQWIVFKSISWVVAMPDRKVGGKERLHLSAE